jgi:hypothetical protein
MAIQFGLAQLFLGRFIKAPGCWLWIGAFRSDGYPVIKYNGKTYRANRVSFEYYNEYIDEELDVLHDCSNKSCINPDHLYLGTNTDNAQDRLRTNINGFYLYDYHVLEIHRRANNGEDQNLLAIEFKISRCMISLIKNQKVWKHLFDS